jgi:hypothetical protein
MRRSNCISKLYRETLYADLSRWVDWNWLLSQRRNAEPVPQPFFRVMDIVVRDSSMRSYTIVPERHSPIVPLHPHLNIGRMGDVLQDAVSMNGIMRTLHQQRCSWDVRRAIPKFRRNNGDGLPVTVNLPCRGAAEWHQIPHL